MTYPQPRTSDQIAAGAPQWRLYTKVAGQGEIYEIDNSCTAMALGPESDFGQIQISYLDPSVPTSNLGVVRLTPQYPYGGRIAPRLDTSYPLSPPRKGLVLASLFDNFNTGYLPSGFDVSKMQLFVVTPVLDIIVWQQPPPTLPQKRASKTFEFQFHACTVAANGGIWYVLPAFLRRYAMFHLFNNSGVTIKNYEIRGVNFSTVSNPNPIGPGPRDDAESPILAAGDITNGTVSVVESPAATKGMYDAYAIFLSTVAGGNISNAPLRVYLTDDA